MRDQAFHEALGIREVSFPAVPAMDSMGPRRRCSPPVVGPASARRRCVGCQSRSNVSHTGVPGPARSTPSQPLRTPARPTTRSGGAVGSVSRRTAVVQTATPRPLRRPRPRPPAWPCARRFPRSDVRPRRTPSGQRAEDGRQFLAGGTDDEAGSRSPDGGPGDCHRAERRRNSRALQHEAVAYWRQHRGEKGVGTIAAALGVSLTTLQRWTRRAGRRPRFDRWRSSRGAARPTPDPDVQITAAGPRVDGLDCRECGAACWRCCDDMARSPGECHADPSAGRHAQRLRWAERARHRGGWQQDPLNGDVDHLSEPRWVGRRCCTGMARGCASTRSASSGGGLDPAMRSSA